MLPGSLLDATDAVSRRGPEGRVTSQRMAVCHVASGDRWAGAEVQVATLLNALARRGEFHLSAILLNDGRLAEEARESGVEVKVIPESQKGFLRILADASDFLQGRGVRILHSHRYKENLLAALLSRRCRVPHVVRTQHGLAEPLRGFKRHKQTLVHWLDRCVARRATDSVISVSSQMRDRLASCLDPRKIVTIHNGVDTARVASHLTIREAKERLGISGDRWVLGTAGRLEPIKRLDIFLAAAERVAALAPRTRFLIVGEGSDETKLRQVARACGLHDQVLFLGHRDDIYDVLRAFDVFVLCSDHEGLPMVLLEALCLGAAVVARPVGGISEVIQDEINGVLVRSDQPADLAEACLRVLGDEELRERLAAAGPKSVVENFSVERAAAAVAHLYHSLCGIG